MEWNFPIRWLQDGRENDLSKNSIYESLQTVIFPLTFAFAFAFASPYTSTLYCPLRQTPVIEASTATDPGSRFQCRSPKSLVAINHRLLQSKQLIFVTGVYFTCAVKKSAFFSATMIVAALVLPETTYGITDASTTESPSRPLTNKFSSTTLPMLQVLVGW